MKEYQIIDTAQLQFTAGSTFEQTEFKSLDFSVFDVKSVTFIDCKFANCSLANQLLTNTIMLDVHFVACNLMGIDWRGLRRLVNPRFEDSKLNYSIFQGVKLKKAAIINCQALDVDFTGADLNSADLSHSSFAGANFDRADLTTADFRTARDYAIDLRTTKIKGARFSYPQVLSLITALGGKIEP